MRITNTFAQTKTRDCSAHVILAMRSLKNDYFFHPIIESTFLGRRVLFTRNTIKVPAKWHCFAYPSVCIYIGLI